MKNYRHAFSLIELSIVIVVIGMLVGLIMGTRELIKNAELNSIGADTAKYIGATKTFRDKYLALPGDMLNATTVWGAAHATPATCKTTVGTGTQTCNGTGDDRINYPAAGCPDCYEMYRFWQQLQNAGLIEGKFTGVQGAGGVWDHTIGANCPASKVTGGAYTVLYEGTTGAANANYFPYNHSNIILFGAKVPNDIVWNPIITATDAQSIDTKLDDGLPATGNIQAFKNSSTVTPGCTTTDVATTSVYNVSVTGRLCNLVILTGF